MGIEPTNPDSRHGSTGFEDQAHHQTRRTSEIPFILAFVSILSLTTITKETKFIIYVSSINSSCEFSEYKNKFKEIRDLGCG